MSLPSYITVTLLVLGHISAENSTDVCDLEPWPAAGPWSAALEEWAVSAPVDSERQARVMSLPPAPGYYVSDRVDRPPSHMGPPPPPGANGPVPYTEWQPPSGPGKIVNKPSQPYKDKPFRPSPSYPAPPSQQHQQQYPPNNHYPQNPNRGPEYPPNRGPEYPPQGPGNPHRGPGPMPSPPNAIDRVDDPPKKQVSETDLYLLSAIEKLVYRVDLMEKRLRKLEENVLYLASGADKNIPEPCAANFSRVGAGCYQFAPEAVDWKSANLRCRKLRANLLELDTDDERRRMMAAMLGDSKIRGMDVWTGGLNPGLLWIWSHSARPILANGTTTAAGASSPSSNITIVGTGRCLALVHDPATKTYVFRGQDCALRHRYICEKEEDKARLGNEIEKVARSLKHTATSARQARLLLSVGDTAPDSL